MGGEAAAALPHSAAAHLPQCRGGGWPAPAIKPSHDGCSPLHAPPPSIPTQPPPAALPFPTRVGAFSKRTVSMTVSMAVLSVGSASRSRNQMSTKSGIGTERDAMHLSRVLFPEPFCR